MRSTRARMSVAIVICAHCFRSSRDMMWGCDGGGLSNMKSIFIRIRKIAYRVMFFLYVLYVHSFCLDACTSVERKSCIILFAVHVVRRRRRRRQRHRSVFVFCLHCIVECIICKLSEYMSMYRYKHDNIPQEQYYCFCVLTKRLLILVTLQQKK